MRDILTALEEHPEWRSALRERLLGEELIELPALFAKFAAETTRRLDLLTRELGEVKSDIRALKKDVHGLKNDVGELKGAHAEAKARENIELIADDLGLEYRRTVPRIELRQLARDAGADVRDDEIKSFVATDIIANADGETTYIAVEASYTGDHYDADRARSHAALMQRFTKSPCRAVIATARNNDRILALIESGEVAWHQFQVRVQPAG